jgi:predicted anti-sigma-YlaC factor YlaD
MERVTYRDWFDVECEQAKLSKNIAYKRMQSYSEGSEGIENCQKRRKEYTNRIRRYLLNVSLRNWNISEVTMKAYPSIKN